MTDQRVVIAGASGLIGSALAQALRADGVPVTTLVRRPPRGPHEAPWLTDDQPLDPAVLAGATAVVCLNGASIGRLPWTRAYRATLRDSRLVPTRVLATALRELGTDAPAFLSASAVGIYGDRPGERLTEQSEPGDTFLAGLCVEWEREAINSGPHTRVALLRTAPLLHQEGVLKPLLTLTRLGVSGPLGSGSQIWPWISLVDEVRAIRHVINNSISGPVNLCGPLPESASGIGRELARQMHRPFLVPAPKWALRLGLGSAAAESLLLPDARVAPSVLKSTGFTFRHRTAPEAISAALGGGTART